MIAEADLGDDTTTSAAPDGSVARTLHALLCAAGVRDADRERAVPRDVMITGVTQRSQDVQPGMLFVAVRGTRTDGHTFVPDAIARGASAVIVEDADAARQSAGDVAIVRVDDARIALARIAAAWHGNPADRLRLAGITGTVGKTSTLLLLEAALTEAGLDIGTVGSLGLRARGRTLERTVYTAPDPLVLHGELARLVEHGCTTAAMEVTSHALAQRRTAGLRFALGVFTNLLPLEHIDYHGSFREYVRAKRRFFDHLDDCATLVFNADDRGVRRLVRRLPATRVGVGAGRHALVRIRPRRVSAAGTELVLHVRRPIDAVGGRVAPLRLPLTLRLLGRPNVCNASLAAAAALCLGADADAVQRALASFAPPRRRMQVIHDGDFTIIDDTVGHPESVSALFTVVEQLAPRAVHIVVGVRGRRGPDINRQLGDALAIWAARTSPATLVVTRSEDATDELNAVADDEYDALVAPLRRHDVAFRTQRRLADAVDDVLEPARDGDLVLLVGAQGMDGAAELALRRTGSAAQST